MRNLKSQEPQQFPNNFSTIKNSLKTLYTPSHFFQFPSTPTIAIPTKLHRPTRTPKPVQYLSPPTTSHSFSPYTSSSFCAPDPQNNPLPTSLSPHAKKAGTLARVQSPRSGNRVLLLPTTPIQHIPLCSRESRKKNGSNRSLAR